MKTQRKLAILALIVILFTINSCKKEASLQSSKSLVKKTNVIPDSMVRTPSGLMVLKSHIHMIENGYHLEIRENQVLKIKTSTGELKEVLGNIKSPIISHINVPNNINSHTLSLKTTPPGGSANGWITSAELYSSSLPINYMSTTWIVPHNPASNDGQLFFIFNCLEPATGPNIIQPVLQWGQNGNLFGGNYWCISNWYGWTDASNNSYYAISSPITVTTGTSLQGVINLASRSGDGSYNFTSTFTGYNNPLNVTEGNTYSGLKNGEPVPSVTIPFINQQFYAYTTLEAYNIIEPSDYSPDQYVLMSGIKVLANNAASTASWTPFTNSQYASVGEHTTIINNSTAGSGQIQLWFHPVTWGNIPVTVNMPSNPSLHVVVVDIYPTDASYSGANLSFTSTSTQNYVGIEPSQTYSFQIITQNQRCHVTINNTYTQDTQGGHMSATFNNITLYGTFQVSVVPF